MKKTNLDASRLTGQAIAIFEMSHKDAAIPILSEDESKNLQYATSKDLIDDLRLVQENHKGKYISRNFYRKHGNFADSAWSNRFGSFAEFRRQAGLELHRGARRIEIEIGKHAANDRYRGFQEVELNPYVGLYERPAGQPGYKTIVVASDFHGQSLDEFTFSVFLDTLRRVRPDVVCLAGDIFDNYTFSRFDIDPRLANLKEEFNFVRNNIFSPIREAVGNTTQIDLIIGNHENRILKHLADKTPYTKCLMDLMGLSMADLLGLPKYEINLVCKSDLSAYNQVDVRSEIKKNYKIYYGMFAVNHDGDQGFNLCGVSGHTHKPKMVTSVDERFGSKFWLTLGCMAKVDAEYVSGLNKYQNGFGVIHLDTETQSCVAENIIVNDVFTVVGGKVYWRQ